MNVHFAAGALAKLDRLLANVRGPGSRRLAELVAGELDFGNMNDRLDGVDKFGRPQTPVKPRKGRYAGATGPPLVPFGTASRAIRTFRARAEPAGDDWRVVAGWEGFVSKAGFPIVLAHEHGVRARPGRMPSRAGLGRLARLKLAVLGGWLLPPRPIMGISPRTWGRIRDRVAAWKAGARPG